MSERDEAEHELVTAVRDLCESVDGFKLALLDAMTPLMDAVNSFVVKPPPAAEDEDAEQ